MSTGSVLLDRPAATYREAEQAGHEAREQFKQRFRSYGRIRLGSKERDSDRARAEWSLAGVVYIHALATIGATEDRLNTAWRSKLRHLITEFACAPPAARCRNQTPRPPARTQRLTTSPRSVRASGHAGIPTTMSAPVQGGTN